jgi:hypothetical protein
VEDPRVDESVPELARGASPPRAGDDACDDSRESPQKPLKEQTPAGPNQEMEMVSNICELVHANCVAPRKGREDCSNGCGRRRPQKKRPITPRPAGPEHQVHGAPSGDGTGHFAAPDAQGPAVFRHGRVKMMLREERALSDAHRDSLGSIAQKSTRGYVIDCHAIRAITWSWHAR